MNAGAAFTVGIYLLEHGGLQAVGDARTLGGVYKGYLAGTLKAKDIVTDANLDAAKRLLSVLVAVVADPSQKAELVALAKSL